MAINLPVINITFKQLVASFIQRSERGNVILIVKDDTDKTFTTKVYEQQPDLDADKTLYTADNYTYISDCFLGKPNKVTVVRIDATGGLFTDALNIIKGLEIGWIGTIEETSTQADQDALVTFVKAQRANKKNFKCAVFSPTTPPNDKGIVVLGNTNVTFKDNRVTQTGDKAIPTLIGYLAGANVMKGTTYILLSNLTSVTEPVDVNTAINAGQLILINDDAEVKIGVGINSLTDAPEGEPIGTENDESYIEIVEAEDMIQDDIGKAFKAGYIGVLKNNLDNQMLFINEVNQYFGGLETINVLDNQYNNVSDIDVDAQRAVLVANNIPGASAMTDAQVKQYTYKRDMYLKADIKILFAIANLNFGITMHN
ncbi:phage tail sheath C-terminal domain-containing protein [Clostridium sp. Mt-5]|uniref:Phage tail sheath C-terminal domain-containing protein n=1 Tax=Clostridium moutaii TaxID=3240932 RepID=A0ABV4BS76_9CLOT